MSNKIYVTYQRGPLNRFFHAFDEEDTLALAKAYIDNVPSIKINGRKITIQDFDFQVYDVSEKFSSCDSAKSNLDKHFAFFSRGKVTEKGIADSGINVTKQILNKAKGSIGESTVVIQSTKSSSTFVNLDRIKELIASQTISDFDLSALIRRCEELNVCYTNKAYYSVGMLVRSIIDHIPPVFGKVNFAEVAGAHGAKSFKDSMMHLEKSSRKIADSILHTHIRRKESLPNDTQIDFSRDLDVLLAEILRFIREKKS